MSKISVNELSGTPETLLIPLYCRARESQQPAPLLNDPKAAEIVSRLDYDFSKLKWQRFTQVAVALRASEFDRQVNAFLANYPDGIIVDIGCGLDTRFYRVDNGSVIWYDLDLPEVIDLRRKLLNETSRCQFIGCSVLDKAWMDIVGTHTGQHFFFVAEAIFPYLIETDVKNLFLTLAERFPGSEIIFDRVPSSLARMGGRWHPTLRATRAQVRWGLGESKALEAWSEDLCLIGEYHYLNSSKLFTGWSSSLRLLPSYWNGFKIVHYHLGVQKHVVSLIKSR